MVGILENVDRRTQLVGRNRLELLLFKLQGPQMYGINVFKVREVIRNLPLTSVPQSSPMVAGITHIRGRTIPIIDLEKSIGGPACEDTHNAYVIISEYNQTVQGFLVNQVSKIVNMNWDDMHPPPIGVSSAAGSYLTAVTEIDEMLVEILDVEKILQEVAPIDIKISQDLADRKLLEGVYSNKILIIDDSQVARLQVQQTIEKIGLETVVLKSGAEGLDLLYDLVDSGVDPCKEFLMIISDVEMPEVDGYTLTTKIREHELLRNLYVVLHTSLSGTFNNALIEKVGANKFIPKFKPDSLVGSVHARINLWRSEGR
jgi:two-component system chemotaxis response regulator CheV